MSGLVLHYAPGSCATASHIALEEAGADFAARAVDVRGGENRTPAYLAINPLGAVPVLQVDGEALTETVAILAWIARAFPEAALAPDDPMGLAQCLSLASWLSSSVHPIRRQSRLPARYADDETAHEAVRRVGKTRFWEACRRIDARLDGRAWAMGEAYSICDPYLLLVYGWAFADGYPLAELEAFCAFAARMLERPAVQRVLAREDHPLAARPLP